MRPCLPLSLLLFLFTLSTGTLETVFTFCCLCLCLSPFWSLLLATSILTHFPLLIIVVHLLTSPFSSSSSFFVAVAWFTFDPVLSGGAGSGLIFSKNNATVSVEGWEHRVALGSVGFSRGVHYWEFTIDNYTADTDPAFGVARIDVARNKMLGKYEGEVGRGREGGYTSSQWVTMGI